MKYQINRNKLCRVIRLLIWVCLFMQIIQIFLFYNIRGTELYLMIICILIVLELFINTFIPETIIIDIKIISKIKRWLLLDSIKVNLNHNLFKYKKIRLNARN